MGWTEQRHVDKLNSSNSRMILRFEGMHIHLTVICKWHTGGWKWILSCEKFGISDVFIGTPKYITKEEVKNESLAYVRDIVKRHLDELDFRLRA